MRIFIAIDIPEEIRKKIVKMQEQLPEFKGRKTEFENLHLTLKFLGEVGEKEAEEVKKKLREIKLRKFETSINSIGFFDNRKSLHKQLIIWLHMTNCEQLQKEVDEKLKDLFEKERRFMSHLTIARVKEIRNEKKFFKELKKLNIKEMGFIVEKFNIKKSKLSRNGSKYETLAEYNLY